jgi:hypothetical protein
MVKYLIGIEKTKLLTTLARTIAYSFHRPYFVSGFFRPLSILHDFLRFTFYLLCIVQVLSVAKGGLFEISKSQGRTPLETKGRLRIEAVL